MNELVCFCLRVFSICDSLTCVAPTSHHIDVMRVVLSRRAKIVNGFCMGPVSPRGLLCPRPGGHRRPSSVRPSVCLSDVAYIGSNSKTKRPRKTKLCTGVPQITCDSHTDFKVKRSKVKVTGRGHIVAAT